jgi:hypothetical protein
MCWGAVLPGLEAAFLPIEHTQKPTAIWRKLAAISNFSKIPTTLLFCYVWSFRKG